MINCTLYTIGYGNRSLTEFVSLLIRERIQVLVDVRTYPYSRHRPFLNKGHLADFLDKVGIDYIFKGNELGGLNIEAPGSQGLTPQRRVYLNGLGFLEQGIELGHRIAVMCCEADHLKCHRYSMIGEDITKRGWQVVHIDKNGNCVPHTRLE